MCSVVIILHCILNGGFTDIIGPIAVPTGDKGHVVQVGRVGHGVLLVLQDLVDDSRDLVGVLSRHTAVKHVREVVVVNGTVIQVGHFLGGITTGFSGDLSRVADKDEEGRRSTLVDTSIV